MSVEVPHSYRAIRTRRRQLLPVRRDRETQYPIAVRLPGELGPPCLHIAHGQHTSLIASDERAGLGVDAHGLDRRERLLLCAQCGGGDLEDTQFALDAGGSQGLAIGRKRQRARFLAKAFDHLNWYFLQQIPDEDLRARTGQGEPLAVGGDGQRTHAVEAHRQTSRAASARQLPNTHAVSAEPSAQKLIGGAARAKCQHVAALRQLVSAGIGAQRPEAQAAVSTVRAKPRGISGNRHQVDRFIVLFQQRSATAAKIEHSKAVVLAAQCHDSAVVRPGQRAHGVAEQERRVERSLGLGIPGSQRAIRAAAGQVAALFRQSQAEHGPGVSGEPLRAVAFAIVHQQRAELAADGEARTFFRPGKRADRLSEFELTRAAREPGMPHAQLSPRIATSERLAARGQRQRRRFWPTGAELEAALRARRPDPESTVGERYTERRSVASESKQADLAIERMLRQKLSASEAPDFKIATNRARK